MKVPTLTTTRTQAPTEITPYSTFESKNVIGDLGLGKLGQGIQQFGEVLQARQDRSDRLATLTNFNDYEAQTAQTLENAKRNAPPDGKDFWKTIQPVLDEGEKNFLSTVPPGLQEETKLKLSEIRQKATVAAQTFQYQQGDKFYADQIGKNIDSSKKKLDPLLGGSPEALEAEKARLAAIINSGDATPAMKVAAARQAAANLEGVALKAEVTGDVKRYGGSSYMTAANLIKGEEGENTVETGKKAFGDKKTDGTFSAYRVGYSSDTITREDGTVERVTKDSVVTRADAERDLARRLKNMSTAISGSVGKDKWEALPEGAKAGLLSVAYNYPGNIPDSVARVVRNGGSLQEIAGAVAALPANPDRRKREAAIIAGTSQVPNPRVSNPRYANVPYEDQVAITRDGITQANQETLAQQKAATDIYNAQHNGLLTGIHDGTMGKTDIDNFRQKNPGMDYKDIMSLDSALAAYTRKLDTALTAQQKFDSGATFDPNSKEDKDALNAYVGEKGLQQLDKSDGQYVNTVLAPAVAKAGDIPTDVAGQLTGMLRSDKQSKALFALQTLAQLQDADPRAFKSRLSQSVQDDVQYWRDRRATMPADELMKQLNPGSTAEERTARVQRRTEAETYLSKDVDKIPRVKTLIDAAISEHKKGWFQSAPQTAQFAPAAAAIQRDYQTAFTDNYEKTGNFDAAAKAASNRIKNDWDVTEIGNPVLMRRPPEKSGYDPYMGSYQYIDNDIRAAHGLAKGDQYQIISDDRTEQEYREWQAGGRPPSYRVVVKKEGEDYFTVTSDKRQWFEVPSDVKQADGNWKETIAAQAKLNIQLNEMTATMAGLQLRGLKPDPEELKQYNDMIEVAARLEDQRKIWEKGHKVQPAYAPPAYNPAIPSTAKNVNPFSTMTRPGR